MKRLVASLLAVALASAAAPARAEDAVDDGGRAKPSPGGRAERSPQTPVDAAKPGDSGGAPEVHYPPMSTRFKLIGAGLFVTAAAWGVSYAAARGWPETPCVITAAGSVYANTITPCTSGPPGSRQLGIPIVGPWLALGKSGCAVDEPTCTVAKPVLRGVAYVIDGVAQIGGLALIAEALIMKTESATDPAKKTSAFALRYGRFEVTPVPVVSPGMSGMSIIGTF